MQARLTQLEADYGIEWQDFRIGDLFSKVKVKPLKYRTSELPNTPKDNFILPALTAGIQNQGLNNYVPKDGATILKNAISISANGANTGATFYQSQAFTVLQDAYAIEWCFSNNELTDNQYLYLTSSISKAIFGNYEWTNKAGWERIKHDKIQLPVNSGKIAFDFMEAFIATLKAYLTVTGLTDTTLTPAEQTALDSLNSVAWGTFEVKELFLIKNTHSILSRDIVPNSGEIPYLTAGQNNNSVGTHIQFDTAYIDEGNCIFIGGKTFVVTYQQDNFFSNDSHNLALYHKEPNRRTKNNLLFMATSIFKSLSPLYSWGDSISNKKIQKDIIQLPITDERKPDYNTMSLVVSAMQKVVIQGVVSYLDARIETTAELV